MPETNSLSIIIPTYDEAENIAGLLGRIKKTLSALNLGYEILVIDDNSTDNTAAIAEAALGADGRVIRRLSQKRGLSLSVLEGIKQAKGQSVIVMDADGSHPPELIPEFIKTIDSGSDLVIASRYVSGGGFRDYPLIRKIISRFACILGRLVTSVKDNTSGFFCIKKDALEGLRLAPKGFKIGLEIFVKANYTGKREIPYIFSDRKAGKSKLNHAQVFHYLMQVGRLLLYRIYRNKIPVLCFLYILTALFALSVTRHLSLSSAAFDLGIFDQAIWNTLHGDFLFSSLKNNISLMGDHFEPILLLFVPFYKLWPDVRVLFLIQSFLLASAVFPLYLIAKSQIKEKFLIYAILFSYMLSRMLRGVGLSDFHPDCFIVPLLFWAYYFLKTRMNRSFFISLLILALCKEDAAFLISGFGIFAFFVEKRKGPGLFLFLLGPLLWIIETKIVAHFNPAGVYPYLNRLPFGQSYADNLKAVIAQPALLGKLFLQPGKIEYMGRLFAPLAFLPLASPAHYILIAIPLLRNILPADPNFGGWYEISSHYTAAIIPFLYIATVSAAGWLLGRIKARQAPYLLGTLLIILAFSFQGKNDFLRLKKFTNTISAKRTLQKIAYLKTIPPDASVAANFTLVPHLSHRKFVFEWNPQELRSKVTQYIVIDMELLEYLGKDDIAAIPQYLKVIEQLGYRKILENNERKFFIYYNPNIDPALAETLYLH